MNTSKLPGFVADASLSVPRTPFRMTARCNDIGLSGVIPQMPKWFKCAVAIAAETAACAAGGPLDPLCLIAAAKAVDVCID